MGWAWGSDGCCKASRSSATSATSVWCSVLEAEVFSDGVNGFACSLCPTGTVSHTGHTEGLVMQVLQNNPNTPFNVPDLPCAGKVLAAEVQDVLSKYIYKQTSSYYSHEYEKDPPNSTVCAWCCFK